MIGPLPTFRPSHPEKFVPAFEQIAQRVKDQWAESKKPDRHFTEEAEAVLTWCQQHKK